jgi:hypothetical protein
VDQLVGSQTEDLRKHKQMPLQTAAVYSGFSASTGCPQLSPFQNLAGTSVLSSMIAGKAEFKIIDLDEEFSKTLHDDFLQRGDFNTIFPPKYLSRLRASPQIANHGLSAILQWESEGEVEEIGTPNTCWKERMVPSICTKGLILIPCMDP